MNNNAAEKWLLNESKKGNALADTYIKLLKDASPEIKDHWMQQLTTMLDVVDKMGPELEKMSK